METRVLGDIYEQAKMKNDCFHVVYVNQTVEFENLIIWHSATIFVGGVGTLINVALIAVFFSFRLFRKRYKLFICLALGDFCNCFGIMLLGISRRNLFINALDTHRIPIQTSLTCAVKPYLWLRVIGTLWPPSTQVAIGFDRAACILKPFWYRKFFERRDTHLCVFSSMFVLIAICVALMKAIMNPSEEVNFICGRKATFSVEYGLFLYLTEVIGYCVALLLNSLAYFTARKVQPTRSVMLQLRKIRYILVLDLLSCVLVALPNIVSLIAVFVGRLPMSISEPADWLSSINSSINFFVYYVMNNEFKRRVDTVCCVRSKVVSLSQ
ncbi:hypothetical protein Tcan_13272 [Toxocara canis]|uniref:G-protein coupled receptors family 1 profile domain-containing protein n=1 Tax=Toxocara canis TaxID=6265 RepID=A0A0B2VWZ2_TOXCA|nr:hypothetical protein Tcan_13272 [Toxocara canis]